jgi:hypothetical protein
LGTNIDVINDAPISLEEFENIRVVELRNTAS